MSTQNAVKINDPAEFHKLYSARKPKVTYYGRDFLDYLLMVLVSAVVVWLSYGFRNVIAVIGLVLCVFSVWTFVVRHGVEWRIPVLLRRPRTFFTLRVQTSESQARVFCRSWAAAARTF